ncbi:MAG: hypothetical protein GEU28_11415 [Dehalococcoidia bacterium]|nr:hypothetical protein [Dehalococcoidia bacterium]
MVPWSNDAGKDTSRARSLRRELRRLAGGRVDRRVVVRTAATFADGVRVVVAEEATDLLLLAFDSEGRASRAERSATGLIAAPPCDMVVLKPSEGREYRRILLAVRGGPYAELALAVALDIGKGCSAEVTLMHIERSDDDEALRRREHHLFQSLLARCQDYGHVKVHTVSSGDVVSAIVKEARGHDLVVLGAGIRSDSSSPGLGAVPEAVSARAECASIVVKTASPIDPAIFQSPRPALDVVVDRWFSNNTFHCREFSDIAALSDLKERSGQRISLGVMSTGNGEGLPRVVQTLRAELQERNPLVDEIAVIGHGRPANDDAAAIDAASGEVLVESLQALSGDIIAWIDGDIRNIHPRMVYGVVGPLLTQERLQYVKGFYERPDSAGDAAFSGNMLQLTELTARPLLNLFFSELSGVVEPLSREHAARRSALERLTVTSGLGVEVGLLIDFWDRFGLDSIAQSDLENRVGGDASVNFMTQKAFAVVQVIVNRFGSRRGIDLPTVHQSMKLIHSQGETYKLELIEATLRELQTSARREARLSTTR